MPSTRSRALEPDHRRILLEVALASIRHGLDRGCALAVDLASMPPELRCPRATFVTLTGPGGLRGCMGRLEATRPMAEDVAGNAFAAAFLDSRFQPMREEELGTLGIHLALLSQPEPIHFATAVDLAGQLVPGRDGVILEDGWRRGTFLPSMWEQLAEPGDFLRHLAAKAGLPQVLAARGVRAFRYRTETVEP